MDKADKIRVKQLIQQLAKKYNLSPETIENVVNSPYWFTHGKLKDLNLEEVNSEEEANALKTNFNYKGLGKLYLSYSALKVSKERKDNYLKINNKRWKK